MPYKEKEIEKLYYSIGEVAKIFSVSTSLIRFWENEFTILKPKKNRKGNRLFTKKDINHLQIIYHLVKEQGFTLEGAKKKLKEDKDEVFNKVAITQSLQKVKDFLIEIRNGLPENE